MSYRVYLRHSGKDKPEFGFCPVFRGWKYGFNINFFYWFLAIRKRKPGEVKRKLVDMKFGKAMQRRYRMHKSEAYLTGRQDGAMSVFQSWINEEGCYWLIKDLLPLYHLTYENDRVRPKRINVDSHD
jgi:hypothetical protein